MECGRLDPRPRVEALERLCRLEINSWLASLMSASERSVRVDWCRASTGSYASRREAFVWIALRSSIVGACGSDR
jgi:hypothetical protein